MSVTKVGLRNAWFQVHKWIGLILAALIIPISLTGSALVWHDPLEKMLHPERHAISGTSTLPLTAYAAAAQAALADGERLQRIELPEAADEPVTATASKPAEGRPQRRTLYLDPPTGKVLGTARSGEGAFQVMHRLHGSLMVPGVGRQVVGWVGMAMLVSSLTGLWLWWPLVGSVRRGLRWKRHANFETNLHHQLGFWISLPLFVLSATGVWISFPQWFAGFEAQSAQRGPGGGGGGPGRFAPPLDLPATALQSAVAKAEAAGEGTATLVGWPTEAKPEWSIEVRRADDTPAKVAVSSTDLTAKVESVGEEPETVARLMRRIHDGNGFPFVWQLVVFLGGILPAILAVTGIIMWWRARGWRGEVATRRYARGTA